MVNLVRIALGDGRILISEVLAISLVMSLASGARALANVVESLTYVEGLGLWTYLVSAVYRELKEATYIWLIPIWILALTTTYLMSNYVLNELMPTYSTLTQLGVSKSFIVKLFITRYLIIAVLTWLISWSSGLIASQILFRFTAYVFRAPYEVPQLSLSDLMELALTTHASVILGSLPALIKVIRGGLNA